MYEKVNERAARRAAARMGAFPEQEELCHEAPPAPKFWLTGRVHAHLPGAPPLAQATITAGSYRATSDHEGRYRIPLPKGHRHIEIRVLCEGHYDLTETLEIDEYHQHCSLIRNFQLPPRQPPPRRQARAQGRPSWRPQPRPAGRPGPQLPRPGAQEPQQEDAAWLNSFERALDDAIYGISVAKAIESVHARQPHGPPARTAAAQPGVMEARRAAAK